MRMEIDYDPPVSSAVMRGCAFSAVISIILWAAIAYVALRGILLN